MQGNAAFRFSNGNHSWESKRNDDISACDIWRVTGLSLAERQLSPSSSGPKTTFQFEDGHGNRVVLLINGDLGADSIDNCKLYHQPDLQASQFKEVDFINLVLGQSQIKTTLDLSFSTTTSDHIHEEPGHHHENSRDIAKMLEWEFGRLMQDVHMNADRQSIQRMNA